MAKRTNILITMERELSNGKTFIDKQGFFCTKDEVEKKQREEYLKALKEDESLIMKGVTFEQFIKENANEKYLDTKDVLATIIDTLFPEQTILVKNEEKKEDVPTAEPETADQKPDTKGEKAVKGGK